MQLGWEMCVKEDERRHMWSQFVIALLPVLHCAPCWTSCLFVFADDDEYEEISSDEGDFDTEEDKQGQSKSGPHPPTLSPITHHQEPL